MCARENKQVHTHSQVGVGEGYVQTDRMWNGEKEQVVTIIMAAEGTVARNMFFILRRTYHQKLVSTSTHAYLTRKG